MTFAELDNLRMHYELEGDAESPVLVLSHALGANLSMWEPQREALSAHFRLLRYDARGHGQSSTPPGEYSIDDLGEDVLDLLDALKIKEASFCGISMGGLVGQWIGIYAPGRLHKLVLANTAAKIGTADAWQARIAAVSESGLAPLIPGTLGRWFTAEFRASRPEAVAAIEAMLQANDAAGYTACCVVLRETDFRERIGTIQSPALVICGSVDPSTTPEDGRYLARNIPGASFVELAAAHLSNVEAASEFNAAVLDFLIV